MPTEILTFVAPPSSSSRGGLLILVQFAPVSALRNRPLPTWANRRAILDGSPARSNALPAGRPVPAIPDTLVHVAPVSVVRKTPPLLLAMTIMTPRGATP